MISIDHLNKLDFDSKLIPVALNMKYISLDQLVRYSRAWSSYLYCLDRGLLQTRMLVYQGLLLVMLLDIC